MQIIDMMQKVKEYESFCVNPNFLDWVKAKKVFTLHLILNDKNLQKYKQNKEYIGLIPESNVIIALIGLEKDGFIKCEDYSGNSCLEYITELNDIEITINIDETIARNLDELLGSCSEKFINYLKQRRFEESQSRSLRIKESKEKQIELQKKMDKLGGLVFDGLYHEGRRVMARVDSNGRTWQLCDDEHDLISVIGKNRIKKGMNKVDLLKKYGLYEAKEVAPAEFKIDESGRLRIERLDDWGEKSKFYIDTRNFMQRIKDDWSWNEVLIIIFMPHVAITFFITENISTKSKKILFYSIIIVLILLGINYGTELHLTYIGQIWFSLIVLYLLIPMMILGTDALLSDDD